MPGRNTHTPKTPNSSSSKKPSTPKSGGNADGMTDADPGLIKVMSAEHAKLICEVNQADNPRIDFGQFESVREDTEVHEDYE